MISASAYRQVTLKIHREIETAKKRIKRDRAGDERIRSSKVVNATQ